MDIADLEKMLGQHAEAATTLRKVYEDAGAALWADESSSTYSFGRLVHAEDLADLVAELAGLPPAGYTVDILVSVDDWSAIYAVDGGTPLATTGSVDETATRPQALRELLAPFEQLEALTTGAVAGFGDLAAAITKAQEAARQEADRQAEAGELPRRFELGVEVTLDKSSVARDLGDGAVQFWVFPEALLRQIESGWLRSLDDWVVATSRTTIVVAGMAGSLEGDVLGVYGGKAGQRTGEDHFRSLAKALTTPPPAATVETIRKALVFRDDHCVWTPSVMDLAPESVAIHDTDAIAKPITAIASELRRLQAILALAFLANRCRFGLDTADHTIELEFRGQAVRTVAVGEDNTGLATPSQLEGVIRLYEYAYDAKSVDKIEIVRQMVALAVDSGDALFSKAREAMRAAEDAHAYYVRDQVAEYFGARQGVQDHVQKTVVEAETAAIELSRDAAERLFKITGIVAGAVVAAALKPDLQDLAGLLAALSIMLYVGLSIRYFAVPLEDSAAALEAQARRHIEAFRDVLGDKTIEKLVEDERVKAAWGRYARERSAAGRWLVFIFFVATVVAAVFAYRLVI